MRIDGIDFRNNGSRRLTIIRRIEGDINVGQCMLFCESLGNGCRSRESVSWEQYRDSSGKYSCEGWLQLPAEEMAGWYGFLIVYLFFYRFVLNENKYACSFRTQRTFKLLFSDGESTFLSYSPCDSSFHLLPTGIHPHSNARWSSDGIPTKTRYYTLLTCPGRYSMDYSLTCSNHRSFKAVYSDYCHIQWALVK